MKTDKRKLKRKAKKSLLKRMIKAVTDIINPKVHQVIPDNKTQTLGYFAWCCDRKNKRRMYKHKRR